MIEVSINGEIKMVPIGLNVKQMLKMEGYRQNKGFAVAVNMTFVAVSSYEETIIQPGDKIDILAPVQGG